MNDTLEKITPVLFKVRQMNGILRGDVTLDAETSQLYRDASHGLKAEIRIQLSVDVTKHFNTDCFVSEVLNPPVQTSH